MHSNIEISRNTILIKKFNSIECNAPNGMGRVVLNDMDYYLLLQNCVLIISGTAIDGFS